MRVFITRQDRENIEIRKDSDTLHVNAPHYSSLNDIKKAVSHSFKEVLPHTHANNHEDCGNLQINSLYSANAHILFGNTLDVAPFDGVKTELRGSQVLIPKKYFNSYEARRGELNQYTLRLAKDKLPLLLSAIGTKLSVCPQKMAVSPTVKEWFSANEGKIALSPFVIMLPPLLQTYVISKALLTSAGCDNKQIKQIISINISNASKLSLMLDQFDYIKDIYIFA